jgi:4-hydroxybenzoate polyprenyltransferase
MLVGGPNFPICRCSSAVASSGYTLWLFIASDVQTILLPSTIFGITNALAVLDFRDLQSQSPAYLNTVHRISLIIGWVGINLLPLTMNNQRSPSSIAEDSLNKPWRPLPSGRLTGSQTKRLMLGFYALALVYSFYSGGLRQCLGLVVLSTCYNSFGAGDHNPVIRNIINALGYFCFNSGAVEVALGSGSAGFTETPARQYSLRLWIMVISAIILTTMHVQDMCDQEGDAKRGRRTLPLVIGDAAARWSIALPMPVWGVICPLLAGSGPLAAGLSVVLAFAVAIRMLMWRDTASDRMTFRVWNLWISVVYMLPLLGGVGASLS